MNRDEWNKFLADHMQKQNVMFFSYVTLMLVMVGLYVGRLLNWF